MKHNPYIHALGAATYILGVVLLISHISRLHHDTPDNIVGSLAALSLFVFSAAVMAFLFFYRPVALLIEGKKEEAMTFFLKTLGTFGLIALLTILTVV
jgi:hypothetical protein